MNKKKRQKQQNFLLVLVLLFNIVTQAITPVVAYAEASEEEPAETAIEEPVAEATEEVDPPAEAETSAPVANPETETPLELLSIADIKNQETEAILTKGIVTATLNNAFYIQDETAGIAVQPAELEVAVGEEVTVSGQLVAEAGGKSIEEATIEEVTEAPLSLDPLLVTPLDFDQHPAELVAVEEVTILTADEKDQETRYLAADAVGTEWVVQDENKNLNLEIGETYEAITGIVMSVEGEWQLTPRAMEDIVPAPQEGPKPVVEDEMDEEELVAEETEPVEEERIADEAATPETTGAADEESSEILQAAEDFDLSLMHMNDTHARAENYPKLLTAVNEFRDSYPESLLFHAGDVFSGTLYFNEFRGQADLALMNLMDIDAMVFGNHEFDLGDSAEGHQALAEFVTGANFPFLGTNIDFAGDPYLESLDTGVNLETNPADGAIYDSIVFEVEGEQIGVFGLTTEDTLDIASPVAVSFNDYLETAANAVQEFEEEGIDKIIALTHLGYDSAPVVGNDLSLAEFVDGIDIIVGGHSHTALTTPVLVNEETENPTVIVQAGQYGEHLGTLNVTFNENGEIIDHAGELVDTTEYASDPAAVEVLAEYQDRVEEINNEEIGAVAVKDLPNPRLGEGDPTSVRANETELGNLVTDAMLEKTKELYPETVIAFQNGGGIRAPIDEGPITVGEVIEVLPFGNNPAVVDLSGQEIKDILEISVSEAPAENGGFLHVSGMKFYYDSTSVPGDRIRAMYVNQGGNLTEIDLAERYLVTTNAFTAQGGDGLEPFAEAYADGRVQDTGAIDWEQLRDYMIEEAHLNGTVDPVLEGRIVDLLGQDLPEDPTNQLRDRIAALEEALDKLEAENEGLREEINALRALLANLQADLEAGDIALAELEQRMGELEARLRELEEAAETPSEEAPDPDEEEQVPDGEDVNGEIPNDGDSGNNGTDHKDVNGDGSGTGGRVSDDSTSDGKEQTTDQKEGSLPKTGTTMILSLTSGVTLLVAGLSTEAYRRQRNKK